MKIMKTGIQDDSFAFPKPVSFTHLIFLQEQEICNNSISCKRSTYTVVSLFVFHVMLRFRAFDDSTNELVGVNGFAP